MRAQGNAEMASMAMYATGYRIGKSATGGCPRRGLAVSSRGRKPTDREAAAMQPTPQGVDLTSPWHQAAWLSGPFRADDSPCSSAIRRVRQKTKVPTAHHFHGARRRTDYFGLTEL